jgi:hypothetical protein
MQPMTIELSPALEGALPNVVQTVRALLNERLAN